MALSISSPRSTRCYARIRLSLLRPAQLQIGVDGNPIRDNVTASVVISDASPINTSWDPFLWSRGIISLGEVRMHGRQVTPYATLAAGGRAGDTQLAFTQIPVGWRVGDELALAGTNPLAADFETERVIIRAINGAVATVDPLRYNHAAPDGYGLTVQVANFTRNVRLGAQDGTDYRRRPHMAFVHNPNVVLENIAVFGFGRTNKDLPINDPVVVNGVLQAGTGTNPRRDMPSTFTTPASIPKWNLRMCGGALLSAAPDGDSSTTAATWSWRIMSLLGPLAPVLLARTAMRLG